MIFFSIIFYFHYLKTLKGEFEISSLKCFNFFESRRKRKPVKHRRDSWLTSRRYILIEALFFSEISSFSWKFQIRPWESLDNENERLLKKNHENRLIDEAKHNFLRIDFGTFLMPVVSLIGFFRKFSISPEG